MRAMNISRWVEQRADWQGDRTAVRFDGAEISYRALDRRVKRLAAMLHGDLAVGPGDRVAHLGYSSPELLDLLFACARIGAMVVPLNWRLAPPEHAWILDDCAPKALLVEPEFFDHVDGIRSSLPELALVAYGKETPNGWQSYDSLLAVAGEDAVEPDAGPDSAVQLVYTSGTTGRPKGTVLTQQALHFNAVNATAVFDLTSSDHSLNVLPMFHVGGMNIHTTPLIHAGGTVTIHRRFDPGNVLREIATSRPNLFIAVPAMITALMSHPDWVTTDVSCLRAVAVGSSTVPDALLRVWHDRGVPAPQVYGLTESAPVAVCLSIADAMRKEGAAGKPVMHCAARIVDDAGRDVEQGTSGEIVLKGENLFSNYWRNDAATAAAFSDDGWFRTGDVGHMDDEGFFYVDERKKDVVISGGENIYPAELENVLADHPDIAESAVVGRPDERWGEIPVACVVPRAGADLTAGDVMALFEGRIARYKHPREIRFMETLPRNAMGKVQKFTLRAGLAGNDADEHS